MRTTKTVKQRSLWVLTSIIGGIAVFAPGCGEDGNDEEISTMAENVTGEGEGSGEDTDTGSDTGVDTGSDTGTWIDTSGETDTGTITDTEPEPSTDEPMEGQINAVLLHHSLGRTIWGNGWGTGHAVEEWFAEYTAATAATYQIEEIYYPTINYVERNDPYDYWKLWIDKAGADPPYQQQPDLDAITAQYNVVVLKHCYNSSKMEPDDGDPRVDSVARTLANYKLQYEALKEKLNEHVETRFVVWTLPANVAAKTTQAQAELADEFAQWVREEWDELGDNIYLWDLRHLETQGGLYLPDELSAARDEPIPDDSHPHWEFASQLAVLLSQRIVDVIEGRGDVADPTGNWPNEKN